MGGEHKIVANAEVKFPSVTSSQLPSWVFVTFNETPLVKWEGLEAGRWIGMERGGADRQPHFVAHLLSPEESRQTFVPLLYI